MNDFESHLVRAKFTAQKLTGTFTVWTRWKDAMGRSKLPRFYAIVVVGNWDLGGMLVENGLARVYGTRTPLPDGRDSRAYLAELGKLEEKAKAARRGGWAFEKSARHPQAGR